MFVILSRLFIAILMSLAGKRANLTLDCDVYLCLSLFRVVSWVRCGTCLYLFLIFVVFLTIIALKASGRDCTNNNELLHKIGVSQRYAMHLFVFTSKFYKRSMAQ